MNELLVTFLCPIRVDLSEKYDINEYHLNANEGLEGLKRMLDTIPLTASGKHEYEIIIKVDDDDVSAINWLEQNQNNYPWMKYIVTERGSNHHKAQYSVIHEWLNECYKVAKPSKWYWLWNHNNQLKTKDINWDEILEANNEDFIWPKTDVHENWSGAGNLFPIVSRKKVEEINSVCDESPFDLFWERRGSAGVSMDDRFLIIS